MKKIVFSLVLIATIVTGGFLAYAIWKAAPGSSKDYLESGKKYYEQKKYPEAVIQLLNAVQKDARNRDARFLLAQSYFNGGDLGGAAKHLMGLLEYYPDDVEASLSLGNIYLAVGQTDAKFFRQASELAQKVLAKQPENVAALILSGNASTGLQDYKSSVEQFEKAVNLEPGNTAALVSMGTSEILQKNYAAAEQAFLKARQVNPKDKSALISLGNYYRAAGQMDKAEAVFKDALSIYPGERAIYLLAAGFYFQTDRLDEAEKVLRNAQDNSAKDDPRPLLVLADVYVSKNRPADARKLLLDIKSKFPQNPGVAATLAQNLLPDQPDKARVEIDQLLKADPKNPIGHILLGEVLYNTGKYDEAESTFGKEPAVSSPFPQPHFFLGNLAVRKGQVDEAISHYQKSLSISSGYLLARVALAETFMRKGQLADSRAEIRKVLQARSDFVPARLVQATLDMADKNFTQAEQELTALLKEQPENALLHRQMGLYYEVRGRTADAEKSLTRALEIAPASQDIFRDLTVLNIRSKQTDRAIQRINAIPDDKKQGLHYELLGLAYSQAGKVQEAETSYKKALEREPGRSSSDAYLVAQYLRSGRTEDALRELDQLVKKNPSNPSAYSVKAQLYESQGKLEEAGKTYAEALKVDPNYYPAANNLAYILAQEGRDLNTALGWAQAARKKEPENPSVADTLGWVYYKLGNHVLARDQLRFAVSKQPDNGIFQYHLAMVYKELRQTSEAQTALKKAINSPIDFKEKSLAQAALREIAKN